MTSPIGWLSVTALLSVYAAVWIICRPYAGLVHDAKLYALQTLATVHPEIFAGDLFLKHGSQDSFTIFPRIYAPIAAALGIESAAAAITFCISALWLGLGFLIARNLAGTRLALLSLGLLIVIPGWYGGYQVIHIGEMYLSARLPAELIGLGAILAHLQRKPLVAFALGLVSVMLHPLMGLPVVGLLVLTTLHARFGVAVVRYAALAAVCGGAVLALAVPVSSVDTLRVWHEIVHTRSGWLFPALWRVADWQYHALVLLTLAILSRVAHDTRTRGLAFCSFWLAFAGLSLAAIAGALTEHPILLRMQPWRWMWIACLVAVLSLPLILQQLWTRGAGSLDRVSAVVLAASWLMADSVGGFLAVAAIVLVYLPEESMASYRRAMHWGAMAVLAFACFANVLPAIQYAAHPFDTNMDSLVVQRVVNAVGSGSFGLLVVAASWALAMKLRPRFAQGLFAILALTLLATMLPRGIRDWTSPKYPQAAVAALSSWRQIVPEQAEVLWLADSMYTWLLLERRNYFSQDQLAGILYSPAMTDELLRRANALTAIAKPEWWTLADVSQDAQPKELTPASLAAVCRAPGLDFVVSERSLGGAIAKAQMPQREVELYLYACKPPGDTETAP
jgi:hypothetical protein